MLVKTYLSLRGEFISSYSHNLLINNRSTLFWQRSYWKKITITGEKIKSSIFVDYKKILVLIFTTFVYHWIYLFNNYLFKYCQSCWRRDCLSTPVSLGAWVILAASLPRPIRRNLQLLHQQFWNTRLRAPSLQQIIGASMEEMVSKEKKRKYSPPVTAKE